MVRAMLRIRQAVGDDLDAIVDIHRQARDSYYRGVLSAGRHAEFRDAYARAVDAADRDVFCGEVDGEPVAFGALGPPFDPVVDADPGTVGQLVGLYVRPTHWGLGIGTALHGEAVRIWRSTGVTVARLEVWSGNARARAFYRRLGWLADGHERPGPGTSTFLRLSRAVAQRR
jgi:ribosomal protein S18 acetylase RimI-like enzyme